MKKYSWIVALLLALSLAFLGCPNDGGKDKDDDDDDVVVKADPIDVAFTQEILDVWGGGDIVAEGDGTGFTFTYGTSDASHGNAVAMFKVDLGEATVRDYEKVTFTFTGISGDLGPSTGQYDIGTPKGVNLLAADDKNKLKNFGGNDAGLVTYIVNAFTGTASGATINAAGAKIGDQPAEIDLELAIAPSRPQASNTGEVWFSIYLHASAVKWANGAASTEKTSFKITNVTFVPLEGGFEGEPGPGPEPLPSYEVANPEVEKKEGAGQTWAAGNTIADGLVSFVGGGLIQYAFDFEDDDGNGVDAYDFVTITYTAETANSAAFKVFGSTTDPASGYKAVASGNDLEVQFELKYVRDGISIQKWGGTDMTFKITKLVFEQGERLPITFRLGAYTGTTPAPTYPQYFVKGTQVGPLPAAPFWNGYLFTGWYKGTTALTPTTNVDATFNRATLTAHWETEPTVVDFTVVFDVDTTNTNLWKTNGSGTNTVTATTTSYTFTQTAGYGPYAMFKITLPDATGGEEGRLAYFDKVTFTYTPVADDATNKNVRFYASLDGTNAGNYGQSANIGSSLGTGVSTTITIDKGTAFADLDSNVVWIGFYIHSNPASYTISNVELGR